MSSSNPIAIVEIVTQGPQGVAGAAGAQGPAGEGSATVAIGTVTTGNAGTNASVTNVGSTTAATLNFTIQRRADFPVRLIFKDSAGTAVNLTGFTVEAQVWNRERSNKFADFGVTYTDRANGTIDIKLTDTQTATFSLNILEYDILLTDPNGDKMYYLEGTLFISEGYTA